MSSIGNHPSKNQYEFYTYYTTQGVTYILNPLFDFTDMAPIPNTIICSNVTITNDGGGDIWFSWDAVHDHGFLYAGETVTLKIPARSQMAIRQNAAALSNVRVWAW